MKRLKHLLTRTWKDRYFIWEGLKNFILGRHQDVAEKRINICRTNKCGFYDKNGSSEKAAIRGAEACGVCGCNLKILTSSLESNCSLKELNKEPLWHEMSN